VVDRTGAGFGATYRWRGDQRDAERDDRSLSGRQDCLTCHTRQAGFVLGLSARQLNGAAGDGESVLRSWARSGMFDPPVPEAIVDRVPRLAPVSDERAPLVDRVRCYLNANCAHCHRPGGVRAEFDARLQTPLERQNLINALPVAGDLSIAGARIIAPGDRSRSILYQRITRRLDAFAMPPLDTREVDREAAEVIGRWIDGLR